MMDLLLSRVSIAVIRPCAYLLYDVTCSSNAPVICNHDPPPSRGRAMDSRGNDPGFALYIQNGSEMKT